MEWKDAVRKTLINHCLCLSGHWLFSMPEIPPEGLIRWEDRQSGRVFETLSYKITGLDDALVLELHYDEEDEPQIIYIKKWLNRSRFSCPECNRLVDAIYQPPDLSKRLACQRCHGLIYPTSLRQKNWDIVPGYLMPRIEALEEEG